MPNSGLEVVKISKSFYEKGNRQIKALESVSVSVREHEIVSLIGPSGCGKSTLLDIVSGLTLPDEGEVYLEGQSITGRKGFAGYMPQKDVLFPWRTILDNVILGLEVQGVQKERAREEAKNLLPVFGLENFADSYPYALSGGMRQRASFLRTYLLKTGLVLLDEPFGKLDAITRLKMQQWFLELWQRLRQSVLFVTHDVEEAILLSDRIYVMSSRPGRVISEIQVGLKRPRDINISGNPGFVELKSEILNLLQEGGEWKVKFNG